MLNGVLQWLNRRWPFSAAINAALKEDIPGGSSTAYTLGSVLLTLVLVQVITGIFQVFFFVPSVDHAYDSLSYLRTDVPFGWLIHGLHYWGANVMIIAMLLHMVRVFVWGAYKRPRELTWLFGVVLLIITMGMSFTGGPLPWDQAGYWAAEVGTSIPSSLPLIGSLTTELMRGGTDMGQLTISRFFVLHVMVLPLVLFAIIIFHIVALRVNGAVGPWDSSRHIKTGPFWPDQAFKDMMSACAIALLLMTLTILAPPGFTGPADPLSTTYTPKPEWNFLFLYEALKYFEGPLEPLGVAGVPAVLVLILVILPFIDRSPERNPFMRPVAMAAATVFAIVLIGLTIAGYVSKPGIHELPTSSAASANSANKPKTGLPMMPENIARGATVYRSAGCGGCHSINGSGGTAGPDLSNEGNRDRDRDWFRDQIRNPKSHFPDTIMPSFTGFNDQQLNDLIDYLGSLNGPSANKPSSPSTAASPSEVKPASAVPRSPALNRTAGYAAGTIGNSAQGALIFDKQCVSCHSHNAIGGIPNPGADEGVVPSLNPIDKAVFNKDPRHFAENVDAFIQHGSVPSGKNPRLHMPSFGDSSSLTQQQISNLEAYIMELNGVDRAKMINPGIEPVTFFFIFIPAFLLIMSIMGGIYRCLPKDRKEKQQESHLDL
ncbi:MAG TPA: cytochrome b N-terminal domain-containing protein [Dissulfurispiraceae bacterium]|nr:cytochrome b N-terminal domain-containing protein [Dissulfurispiraceae bacterium]